MNKEALKQIFFLKSAVSSRNLTSLLLVGLFFGVYVAAGGKISSVPNIKPGQGFGTIKGERQEEVRIEDSAADEAEEEATEAEFVEKKVNSKRTERASLKRKVKEAKKQAPKQLEELDAFEAGDDDDLSSIEKRLKLLE